MLLHHQIIDRFYLEAVKLLTKVADVMASTKLYRRASMV
jgi:hypothetical protein